MLSTITTNLNPLPLTLDILRAGLRRQGALTQRQLATLGLLVRNTGEQLRGRAGGTLTGPMLDAQTRTATSIAGGMIDITRVLCDLHARSAAEMLGWWERRLQASMPIAAPADEAVEPRPAGTTTADLRSSATRAAPAGRTRRSRARGAGTGGSGRPAARTAPAKTARNAAKKAPASKPAASAGTAKTGAATPRGTAATRGGNKGPAGRRARRDTGRGSS